MNDQHGQAQAKTFRGGFSLTAGQIGVIETKLSNLLQEIPARLIVLVDVSGQFVCAAGETVHVDIDALGSLIAGDLAASQEIARMTGEVQSFQMILREGQRSHIIISEAGDFLILLVQFSRQVPLGWARKLIQHAAGQVTELVLQPFGEEPHLEQTLPHEGLNDLFNDALDDLWKG